MRYMRLTCVMILAALVLAPAVWSQNIPTQEELADAITKVKATMDSKQSGQKSFKSQLQRARTLLANNPELSLAMVTGLLDANETTIRLNAAITLAETAQRTDSASQALIDALKRCLKDPSSAVAYWGLNGLVADSVPVAKQVEAIEASLDIKRPRLLRLAAARIASEKRLRAAVPPLVAHLQRILPSYSLQVKTILTYELEVDVDGEPLNPDMVNPGYTGRTRSAVGTGTRGHIESPLDQSGGRQSTGGMGGMRGGMGGARGAPPSSGAMGGRGSAPPSSTGSRRSSATTSTRRSSGIASRLGDEDIRMEKRQLDPSKLGFEDVKTLILDLQELPSVYELHEIGYITEILAREDSRDMPFGEDASFERTPPWGFGRCVEAAVAWLDENRAEFPNAPAPVKDTAAEEATEPAAPVEETPET